MYSAEHKTSSHIIIIINIPLINNLTVLDVPTYCACNVYGHCPSVSFLLVTNFIIFIYFVLVIIIIINN